jgi:Terminase small subunit
MRPLSYRQRLFVEYYLGASAGCAVDAARRAGYSTPHPEGVRLLRSPTIRAAINARVATAAMAASEVLARIADLASADLTEFIDIDPKGVCKVNLKLIKRLGLGHLIKRVRINKDGTQDIELEAKLPALVKLGEHYNLFKREAQPQVTLVDLAKHLRARYEELRRTGECGEPLEDLQEQTEPVQ